MCVDARELAWAAGLFEGEGCIGSTKSDNYPRLTLSTTDEDTIRRFHAAVGGFGNVGAPFWAPLSTKPVWRWTACKFEHVQAIVVFLWYGLGDRRRAKAIEVLANASFKGDATGAQRRLTNLESQRLDELLRLGVPGQRIRNELGCSSPTVVKRRKKLGLSGAPRRVFSFQENTRLENMLRMGFSDEEIAVEIPCSALTVRKRRRKLGLVKPRKKKR